MKQSVFDSDFNLSVKEYSAANAPLHRHNYFELIYVLSGRGIHIINENQFAYARGDLFLLSPADSHTFEAHEQSTFCIIDFTSAFFGHHTSTNKDKPVSGYFFKQLEYIFQNAAWLKGYISLNETDKTFAGILVQRLISEWDKEVFLKEIILQNLVFLLLNIIARYASITISGTLKVKPGNKAYEMIAYLQHHIYNNELLTLENLASQFNLSKDYAGAYFKKHTGKSIKRLILAYKLELVKTRLLYSDLSIAQIAIELNFTDESHLNKTFKKAFGETAAKYRKENNHV